MNVITQYPDIRLLALKHNVFDDSDVQGTLFMKPQPNIVFLDLSYSFKSSADALVTVIKACPNLEFLSLRRSCVDDKVLEVIINSLNKLQYLNLHGTQITSRHFLSMPEKLPKLTALNLCVCRRIDPHVLIEIVNLMPELHIVKPRGGSVRGARASEIPYQFQEQRNVLKY